MNKNDIGVIRDMGKVRKSTFLCFAVILSISMLLNGCNLANPELQDIKKADQLIGVFVTAEEDLKDYRLQEGDTLYYQEKKLVRADGSIRKLTDKEIEDFDNGFTEEGIKQEDGNYRFGEIEGYYFGYEVTKGKTGDELDEIWSSCSSPSVYSVYMSTNTSDEEHSVTVSGTIGVASDFEGGFRVNNVYKRADGTVYVQIPSHPGIYISDDSGGGDISQSISESTQISTSSVNKVNKKESTTFTVTIEQADFLKGATIKQMDETDHVILETAATFDKLESNFILDDKTAYVIVEESLNDKNGEGYIKRTAYDCEKIGKNGVEDDPISHTFHYTNEKEKITLVHITFVR